MKKIRINTILLVLSIKIFFFCLYWLSVEFKIINQFYLLDDIGYLEVYNNLQNDFSYSVEFLTSMAGGQNALYYVFIHLSQTLLSPGYFSAVLLNNLIYVLVVLLLANRLTQKEFILIVLFPSILSWLTIFNLKEFLVLLSLLIISKAKFYSSVTRILLVFFGLFILFYTRFYLVPVLILSYVFYYFQIKKIMFFLFGVFSILLIKYMLQTTEFVPSEVFGSNILYGFIRFIITPLPFQIDKDYSFLYFSILFEYILVFSYFKYLYSVRKFQYQDYVIIIMVLFYAAVYELQGPRHRLPVELLMITSIYGQKKNISIIN